MFKPALALSGAVVAWINQIAAARAPLECRLNDRPFSMRMERLVWTPRPPSMSMLQCVWGIADETIVLSIPPPLLEALISTVQNGLAGVSEPSRSLIVELALEPLLARLEARVEHSVQLLRLDAATPSGPYLEFEIIYGSFTGKARLFLFSPLDGRVPTAFRILGELLGQLPREPREPFAELPIIMLGEIGALRATVALLRKADAGDALLPDIMLSARGQAILTAGKLWAPADIAGDRLILRGPLRLQQPHPLEGAHMKTELELARPPSEADLDDIEITLVFECGRWPIALGTLKTVGEGHVFELGRPLDGPVDIVANGRRIGRGDIVCIGEQLAVRLRDRLAVND